MTRVPWRFRWVGVGYLLLVVGVAVFVGVALGAAAEDANLAGVWLFLVSFPGALLVTGLSGTSAFVGYVAVGVGQAGLVLLVGWWLDRRLVSNAKVVGDRG